MMGGISEQGAEWRAYGSSGSCQAVSYSAVIKELVNLAMQLDR